MLKVIERAQEDNTEESKGGGRTAEGKEERRKEGRKKCASQCAGNYAIALLTSLHQNYSRYLNGGQSAYGTVSQEARGRVLAPLPTKDTRPTMDKRMRLVLFGLLIARASCSSDTTNDDQQIPHHRQKRVFWITNDGRIALPPGTVMTITPTLAMPFVRYPPYGFLSNMTISLPFTIDFDKLGLTDNENPYGALPPVFDSVRNIKGRQAGAAMADFIASFVKRRLGKRQVSEMPRDAFHGGERALLYGTAEDMLSTLGLNGRACVLRAICEVQGHPLSNFGLIGEMLKLFFTASKSPFASLLNEYVEAENRGKTHGECWPYFKDCPKSLFLPSDNKYTKDLSEGDLEGLEGLQELNELNEREELKEVKEAKRDERWDSVSPDLDENLFVTSQTQSTEHTINHSYM